MKFKFCENSNFEMDDFESCYEVKIRIDVTRKGYNPNGKDKKKAEIARKRARNAKYARLAR